jgi:glycine hydroxymethyltransferase
MKPEFQDYAAQIKRNTEALAEGLREKGLNLVSGGTDNHLVLLDLREESVTGKEGESLLEDAGIVANKNAVPYDPEPPMVTSGVRLGTPALTTRGMAEQQLNEIGKMIGRILKNPEKDQIRNEVSERVSELLNEFPLYADSEVDY